MEFLTPLLFTVGLLVVLGGIGRLRERRHIAELSEREERVGHIPILDTSTPPPGLTPVHSELVLGNAVIGTDYLKQWFSSWRGLVGGEMHAYQTVMTRARREAQLRMTESAEHQGARAVINVRFETSQITTGRSIASPEILCYGTMVR